jgi:Na+-driven multidrug efflux pump
MVFIAVLNIILDPILIFGYLGFPALGIRGAVIATIISRAVGGGLSLWFVGHRYKLFDFRYSGIGDLTASWKEIALIGIPNMINRLLPQIIRASMTRLVAGTIGVTAVAAIAAGQRIESFATIAGMGIGTTIIPIVGQNFGRGRMDRVLETRRLLIRTAIGYGLTLFLLMLPLGRLLAGIFTDDPAIQDLASLYLRIIMIGTIGLNHYNWISEAFNAVGKPRYVLLINLAGTLLIILPMMYTGIRLAGFPGLVTGLAAGQITVGLIAILLSRRNLTEPRP